MRQPGGHVQEITRSHGGRVLSGITPAHERLALEDVDNRILLAVMMNAGSGQGLDDKGSGPQGRNDAVRGGDGRRPQRSRGLERLRALLLGMHDANCRVCMLLRARCHERFSCGCPADRAFAHWFACCEDSSSTCTVLYSTLENRPMQICRRA